MSLKPLTLGAILALTTIAVFIGSLLAQNFGLAQADPSAASQKALILGSSGEPHIWLRDQEGIAKVQVALTGKGLLSITLADQRGRDRAVLALSQEGGQP
ncbi:MAG: hypothetical protein LBT86_00475 [Deltaproteobacteria bacterium]|jgi:hypothetical protein|nr:hypothetical protein [Deltaproteobacteria bacterium]